MESRWEKGTHLDGNLTSRSGAVGQGRYPDEDPTTSSADYLECLHALGLAPLLRAAPRLTLPDFDRAERIGEF
jgi:hypothetical protein